MHAAKDEGIDRIGIKQQHALSVAAILNDKSPRPKAAGATASSLSFIIDDFQASDGERKSSAENKKKRRRFRAKCTEIGCTKTAKARGKCNTHGGGQQCSAINCTNFAVTNGKCITHGVRCGSRIKQA